MKNELQEYNHLEIEKKWQKYWEDNQAFIFDKNSKKEKYYVLEMFPYPSGKIHLGHVRNYTIGDVIARFKKNKGYEIIHPMGWDAFGLPAENAATKNNTHPADWTYENISIMREQIKNIGISYDWNLELSTCDPNYYRHEQKLFLEFFRKNIAYKKESLVNWDPIDQTILANEQVIDGKGWRSGALIEKRKLSQWFFRITDYAEELLNDLNLLTNWPKKIVEMQRKWIGKSEGCLIDIYNDLGEKLTLYTTTPEMIYGASFFAISPSHELAEKLSETNENIKEFLREFNKSDVSEASLEKNEKKGIFTNIFYNNPFVKGEKLPLYIANFVIMDSGTGVIFGCPGHDARDHEFALKYNLSVKKLIDIDDKLIPYEGEGNLINSEFLNGLTRSEARKKIIDKIEELNIGQRKVNYRLRDWGVSRQRYWGAPIPIIYCNDCGIVEVAEKDLPVTLPYDVSFSGRGNPLANHPTWKNVKCPKCNNDATRETDTFDTFVESSWYYFRYLSPQNQEICDRNLIDKYMPVDQYIGGAEHAVLHLLYARFFAKIMRDYGYSKVDEPFISLINQGMICHETYESTEGEYLYPTEVIKKDKKCYHILTNEEVKIGRMEKMSKSKKNTINLEDIIASGFSMDVIRLFILSDSPPERDMEWTIEGIEGSRRYIQRLWQFFNKVKLIYDEKNQPQIEDKNDKILVILNNLIFDVTKDIEEVRFNKLIARIREFTNILFTVSEEKISIIMEASKIILRLLNPIIPHITEELWQILGESDYLYKKEWPVISEKFLTQDIIKISIQVNGKLRDVMEVEHNISEEMLKSLALKRDLVKKNIDESNIKKVIIIPNKTINFVI